MGLQGLSIGPNPVAVGRTIQTLTGFNDIDVSAGAKQIAVTGYVNGKRIRRAWFYISANGGNLGANTEQPLALAFFSKDTYLHLVDDDDPDKGGLVDEFPENEFVVQDVKVGITATDASIDIDDTTLYADEQLIRLFDGTVEEFQRIDAVTDADTLALKDTMANAFLVDDDVASVMELGPLEYEDKDDTDEIHLLVTPGNAAGDDVRLHWIIEFEDGE